MIFMGTFACIGLGARDVWARNPLAATLVSIGLAQFLQLAKTVTLRVDEKRRARANQRRILLAGAWVAGRIQVAALRLFERLFIGFVDGFTRHHGSPRRHRGGRRRSRGRS